MSKKTNSKIYVGYGKNSTNNDSETSNEESWIESGIVDVESALSEYWYIYKIYL